MQRASNKCNASGATGPKHNPSPNPEITVLLSPQRMKVVGWGGQVHDLQMSGSLPKKSTAFDREVVRICKNCWETKFNMPGAHLSQV